MSRSEENQRTLAEKAAARRRLLNKPRVVESLTCIPCQDMGLAEYNPLTGVTRYCEACEKGRVMAVDAARFYAEMKAEREAHIRAVNERNITRFTELHEVRIEALPADMQQFLDRWDGHRSLLLLGPWGVGKTWRLVALARAIQARALCEEWTMRLITVPDLLDALRNDYDHENKKAAEGFGAVIQQYKEVRLLILDDWGKEKPTDWVAEQIFKIVNYRYEHRLPMFLSSNLTKAQLDKDFPAEMDRFRQICQLIEYAGESKRKQGGK